MIETTAHPSIDPFAPNDWSRPFPHELEDHASLCAITLHANAPGYRHRNRFVEGVCAYLEKLARLDCFADLGNPAAPAHPA